MAKKYLPDGVDLYAVIDTNGDLLLAEPYLDALYDTYEDAETKAREHLEQMMDEEVIDAAEGMLTAEIYQLVLVNKFKGTLTPRVTEVDSDE